MTITIAVTASGSAGGGTAAEVIAAVSDVWPWFWPAVAATLGAVLASFVCVVGERVPAGRSVGGRSACVCGRQLTWWENVPVLGWAAAGGVARCCQARIPTRYVTLELAAGAASAAAVVLGGVRWATVAALALVQAGVLAAAWRR
jgi:prepilin signal peptidase PulO-like enzyme (type II secretory pathway)